MQESEKEDQSILIIETPENCKECIAHIKTINGFKCAGHKDSSLDASFFYHLNTYDLYTVSRPCNCPLKSTLKIYSENLPDDLNIKFIESYPQSYGFYCLNCFYNRGDTTKRLEKYPKSRKCGNGSQGYFIVTKKEGI